MAQEDYETEDIAVDEIEKNPEEQVDDDAMSGAEAGFQVGSESAYDENEEDEEEKEKEESPENSEFDI